MAKSLCLGNVPPPAAASAAVHSACISASILLYEDNSDECRTSCECKSSSTLKSAVLDNISSDRDLIHLHCSHSSSSSVNILGIDYGRGLARLIISTERDTEKLRYRASFQNRARFSGYAALQNVCGTPPQRRCWTSADPGPEAPLPTVISVTREAAEKGCDPAGA